MGREERWRKGIGEGERSHNVEEDGGRVTKESEKGEAREGWSEMTEER